jgi:hypothetical protein
MAAASAERANKPVIPSREKEEYRAVVLAKAARLLAGALMVRLIRASRRRPARPGHGARAAPGWPDAGAGVRQLRAGPAGRQCQEQKAMSAEPPHSTVTEGGRTLEVRWIFPGQLETALAGWFARFPAQTESREDTYLRVRGCASCR